MARGHGGLVYGRRHADPGIGLDQIETVARRCREILDQPLEYRDGLVLCSHVSPACRPGSIEDTERQQVSWAWVRRDVLDQAVEQRHGLPEIRLLLIPWRCRAGLGAAVATRTLPGRGTVTGAQEVVCARQFVRGVA